MALGFFLAFSDRHRCRYVGARALQPARRGILKKHRNETRQPVWKVDVGRWYCQVSTFCHYLPNPFFTTAKAKH